MNTTQDQEIRYRVLTLLSKRGSLSQREMAGHIGISLGKMNHFLSELSLKGLILVQRSRISGNRIRCLYLLTSEGLEEKAELALKFLKTKIREYKKVKQQIRELAKEVGHENVTADLEGEGQKAV
jgi:EPS-associated MarR family transcriptional regulator